MGNASLAMFHKNTVLSINRERCSAYLSRKLDGKFATQTLQENFSPSRLTREGFVLDATRKGNTDEDDSGLARALGYVDYGEYL